MDKQINEFEVHDSNEESVTKRRRIRIMSELIFLLSVIFCVALSIIYLSRYATIKSLLEKEKEMVEKVQELERENKRLKEKLDQLSTPAGIERLARERLGLVRPEEVLVYPIPVDEIATESDNVFKTETKNASQ